MPSITLHCEPGVNDGDETEAGTVATSTAETLINGATSGTNKHQIGLRFTNVTVPKKAKITKAKLTVFIPTGGQTTIKLLWRLCKEDSAAEIKTTEKNLSSRTSAKDSSSWEVTGTANANNSHEIANSVMEELFAREGWASGNALMFIGVAQSSCKCTFQNYDKEGNNTHSAQLEIVYEETATSSSLGMII